MIGTELKTSTGVAIEFTHEDDSGEETTYQLPARYEVCSRCQGHGSHLTPSIGQHAYSREEFEESFDEEERGEYFRRGGRYDVACEDCKGVRVVAEVDEAACNTPELKASLSLYHGKLEDEAQWRTRVPVGGRRAVRRGAAMNRSPLITVGQRVRGIAHPQHGHNAWIGKLGTIASAKRIGSDETAGDGIGCMWRVVVLWDDGQRAIDPQIEPVLS